MASVDSFQELDNIIEPPKKRNPLVLVGTLATAGVLVAGLVAFRKGRQDISQNMMRARVVFQGATVALMVGSTGFYAWEAEKDKKKHKTSEKLLS
eukprot:jgi/Botrbrau1/22501/Bobra.114_2s0027.1